MCFKINLLLILSKVYSTHESASEVLVAYDVVLNSFLLVELFINYPENTS